VAQQTGRQYDDDLTVGADDYNESFSTGYVDLFEPLGDNDAPIAKLKTIILSIDWEITDDILHQLHNELQDLKDIWAGNKINLIYIQALEKIGRYIFAEKANSHPNAIKLLLAFYSNLERIVSSTSMSEEEKKQLLLQDVKRFDQFKIQITSASKEKNKVADSPVVARAQVLAPVVDVALPSPPEQKNVLTNLKAIVLGIDWEISDNELVRLSEEVSKLEKVFSENRAKLIFLQGIGALGNYIRSAKSNAHPDAFKLLHSFCKGLEKTYTEVLSGDQEKEILLAEVKKFNAFKSVIATVASEVVVPVEDRAPLAEEEPDEEEESDEESGVIVPAFADMPEDVRGFREDAEAVKSDVDKSVASFLGEEEAKPQSVTAVGEAIDATVEGPEVTSRLDALFGEMEEPELTGDEISVDLALSGVEVETEADDDSDEQALPLQAGALAPALAEASGQSLYAEAVSAEEPLFESSFSDTAAVPGVDVETEADDESGEAALPREEGGVAPALAFADEEYGFREAEFVADPDEEEFDLEDRLHSFFGAEIEEASQGSTFQVPDTVSEEALSVEISPEEDYFNESKEAEVSGFPEEPKILITDEILAATKEVEPAVTDVVFEEESVGWSAEAGSESLEVVFEPVGEDVGVDELPVKLESGTIGYDTLAQETLAGLRECVAAIVLKKYEDAFPSFFAEINRLRQDWWQTQYIKNTLLQLLLTVGQYIDTYRAVADDEALTLLQSLCDKLEQVCQGKTGLGDGGGREQILFKETGAVLLWQQRLIAALMARNEGEDISAEGVDDLTDLFSEK
jgi:pilus assembly protein FimV